jgi:predicted ferric reductase
MIAGGSGITPMYQVAQGILRNPLDATKVFLIYANVTEEDILLRKELDAWARDHRARFKVCFSCHDLHLEASMTCGICTYTFPHLVHAAKPAPFHLWLCVLQFCESAHHGSLVLQLHPPKFFRSEMVIEAGVCWNCRCTMS